MKTTDETGSRGGASEAAPDSPAESACRCEKVPLSGRPPRKSEVEALMKRLEWRGVLGPEKGTEEGAVPRRARETAEFHPQAVPDTNALAKVIPFKAVRK